MRCVPTLSFTPSVPLKSSVYTFFPFSFMPLTLFINFHPFPSSLLILSSRAPFILFHPIFSTHTILSRPSIHLSQDLSTNKLICIHYGMVFVSVMALIASKGNMNFEHLYLASCILRILGGRANLNIFSQYFKSTKQQLQKLLVTRLTIVTVSPEVSSFTILRQDVRASSLEVQHAAVESPVMRVAKGNARSWTRNAVRTTQTWDDCWHLILMANTHKHTHRGCVTLAV